MKPAPRYQVAAGVTTEADLEATGTLAASWWRPTVRSCSSQAASLEGVLDALRLQHPDTGDEVEPEQCVAGDCPVGSLDGESRVGS